MLERIWRATLNYGLGSLVSQIVGFLLLPVYTAFLTPHDYGLVELTGSFVALCATTMRVGVPGAVARFYYDYADGTGLKNYVTTIHLFITVSGVLVGCAVLVALRVVGDALVPGLPVLPFGLLAVVSAFLAGNSDLQRRLIQAREQSAYSAKLSLALGLTAIALTIVFVVVLRWGGFGMVFASTLTALVFYVQAQWYLRRDLGGRPRMDQLWDSLKYGGGVLPSHLVSAGSSFAIRAILSGHGSVAAVGLFGLGMKFLAPLNILVNAFKEAYLPVYFAIRKKKEAEGEVDRLVANEQEIWVLAVFGFLTMALLGPIGIELLTPERFHAAAPLVPILGLGFLAQVLQRLMGPEIFYSKKTSLLPIISATAGLITILVTFAAVRKFGATGASWGFASGMIASALMAALFSVRLGDLRHNWPRFFRTTALGVTLAVLGSYAPQGYWWISTSFAVLALAAYPAGLWLLKDEAIIRLGLKVGARLALRSSECA